MIIEILNLGYFGSVFDHQVIMPRAMYHRGLGWVKKNNPDFAIFFFASGVGDSSEGP